MTRPNATTKASVLTGTPLILRIPAEFVEHIDALVPMIAADSDVATMLGGVTRSAVVRYAPLEGVKSLERRHGKR